MAISNKQKGRYSNLHKQETLNSLFLKHVRKIVRTCKHIPTPLLLVNKLYNEGGNSSYIHQVMHDERVLLPLS